MQARCLTLLLAWVLVTGLAVTPVHAHNAGPSAEAVSSPSEMAPHLEREDPPADGSTDGPAAPSSSTHDHVAPADNLCVPDPAGDTIRADNDDPVNEPRADLVAFCADYDDELRLEAEMNQATDPEIDHGWARGSAIYWFLNTDGNGYDHTVVFSVDDDGPVAEVIEIGDDGSEQVTCSADAAYADGRYVVSGIDPDDCLPNDSPRIDVAVITQYVTGSYTAMDVSDTFIAVGRTGDDPYRSVSRLAGADRTATAVEISQQAFSQGADAVYLATAETFPDALAAGPLADGPTLLVPSCGQLPGVVADEVSRLDPSTVIGLGGDDAVCDALLGQAADESQASTDRLAGPADAANRFGTSAAISRRAFPTGAHDVYLATGEEFPDALAAGSLTDGPVLLVPSCGDLPGVIADEIERTGADRVLALGGDAAVCDDMLDQAVAVSGGSGDRLAGATRFDTAATIARFQFPDGTDTAYLARHDAFPDALAAGSLTDGPVLLVPSCGDIPVPVANVLRALDPSQVTALGGESAVCDDMLRHAGNA